jgi:small subunit ribosomal protein S5
MRSYSNKPQEKEFDEKVIQVSRVSKKTKGGNKIGFSVLMVVGDKKGKVGVGLGKAGDVLTAIRKGIKKAKKKLIEIPLDGTTIPFPMQVKNGAARIMLKPAPKGSGVIAGGPVRAVVEAAGVRDISSKIMGTENQASNVYATFEALNQIKKIVELKGIKLRSIADIEAEEQAKIKEMQDKAKKKSEEKSDAKKSAKKAAAKASKATTAKAEKTSKAAPKKTAEKKTEKKVAPKKEAKKAAKK